MYTEKLMSLFYRGGQAGHAGSSGVISNKNKGALTNVNNAGPNRNKLSAPIMAASSSSTSNLPASANNGYNNGSNAGLEVQSLPVEALERRVEVEALRKEVSVLRQELSRCRETIAKMHDKEKMLRERLSDQVQKQFEKSTTKFEDLSLGENRPTQLLRRFGNLYSQTRLDAYDALDDLPEMMDFDDLKGKLLFSVIVLAFRSAQMTLHKIKSGIRNLLCIEAPDRPTDIPTDPLAGEVETTIAVFLRKSIDKYNIDTNISDVSEQVYATLFDYPSLRQCEGLRVYIEECVKLAWAGTVQNPPLVLEYERRIYSSDMHTRFHSSNADSDQIQNVLWPALLEGENGPCVHKGVVVT